MIMIMLSHKITFKIIPLLVAIALSCTAYASTFTVINTYDSGAGSLRQAITDATTGYTGNHSINFNIPITDPGYDVATGTFTIHLLSELPYLLIGGNITIDATTQTANVGNTNAAGPEIVIDGGNMSLMSCFRVASAGNTIKGFCIGGFQYAILMFGANGGNISDCYLGTAPDGVTPFPNQYGIGLSGGTYGAFNLGYARNITISNNVISGNTAAGIVLEGSGTQRNVITGNHIGTSATGNLPLSNHYGIIMMTDANNNLIGGLIPADRNIISANTEIGIYIESCDSNIVCGNYIGVDATGTFGFTDAADSALQANGVEINTTGKFNRIGGTTANERNIISGNRVYGCIYYGNCSQNNICGNYIGTDATGEYAIPNATGICVDGSSNHNIMENNLLSGNRSYGLFIVTRGTDNNIFRGNLVGTNADGTRAIPNDVGLMLAANAQYNIIGGDNENDRNLFSGNTYAGIEVTDNGTYYNQITGNYIGVDISGNQRLANGNGIIVSALVKNLDINRNIISGNDGYGVVITDQADSNVLRNNKIGIGADTSSLLGNSNGGIVLSGGATHNRIGGDGEGNTIFKNLVGIALQDDATKFNTFSQNSIFENDLKGIFFADGCNDGITAPTVNSVVYDENTHRTWIQGTVQVSEPETSVVEVFTSECGAVAGAQGKNYLGRETPNATGWWQLIVSGLELGTCVTATVTDSEGNTSPFAMDRSSVVGIPESTSETYLVWPNPTKGTCFVRPTSNVNWANEWSVCDVFGKEILHQKIDDFTNIINLTNCASGIYFIRFFNNGKIVSSKKIIKE